MSHLYDFLKKHALENPLTYAFMGRRTGKTTLAFEMADLFQNIDGYKPIIFLASFAALRTIFRERPYRRGVYANQEWSSASMMGNVLICDDCTPGWEQIRMRPDDKIIILRTPFYYEPDGQKLREHHIEHWRIWFNEYPQGGISDDFYASQIQARSRDWISDPSCHEVPMESLIRKA